MVILTTLMNKVYGVLVIVSICIFSFSCSWQKRYTRDEYLDQFFKYLKENNDQKIDKMIYHFSNENDSYEHKRRSESVAKINSVDSQTSMKMVFSFPVRQFSYKVTDFEATDTINDRKGTVEGPQRMAN
jgi:hypothetical protein